jgi:hypothetical protein
VEARAVSLGRRLAGWLRRGRLGNVEPDAAELAALDQRVEVGEVDPADADRRALEAPAWVDDPAKRYPPLVQDPRVATRTPASQLLGYPGYGPSGDASRLGERYWGVAPDMPAPDALARSLGAARQTWTDTRPGDAVEALRWAEQVGGPPTITVDDELAPELFYEVTALRFQARSLAVLEQLATFYRAGALDEAGQPVGNLFIGSACECDILARAQHPVNQGELVVRWILLRTSATDEGPPLAGVPEHHLPLADSDLGLPREWSDLRFAWGNRYTRDFRCVVRGDGGSTLRLFAGLRSTGRAARFRVDLRGRLAGWSQIAGPLATAFTSSRER